MTAATLAVPLSGGRFALALYRLTLAFMALSGFAQMPIFKRYYIADIPGLGWLDAFYVTHYMHYLAAIVLLFLVSLALGEFPILLRPHRRISVYGWVQGALMAGIVVTGGLQVIKNFEGDYLSAGAIVFLDITHLALALVFLMVGLAGLLGGKRWTTVRERFK